MTAYLQGRVNGLHARIAQIEEDLRLLRDKKGLINSELSELTVQQGKVKEPALYGGWQGKTANEFEENRDVLYESVRTMVNETDDIVVAINEAITRLEDEKAGCLASIQSLEQQIRDHERREKEKEAM